VPGDLPVVALQTWQAKAAISDGPVSHGVSRHGHVSDALIPTAVALIVKERAFTNQFRGARSDSDGVSSTRLLLRRAPPSYGSTPAAFVTCQPIVRRLSPSRRYLAEVLGKNLQPL
jgi:hypothetical protein